MRAPAVGLVAVPAKGFPPGLPAWQEDGDGYTWWDGASCDPLISSHVARALRGLSMSRSVVVMVEDKHTHLCLSCPLSVCHQGKYKCPISAARRTADTAAPGARATILAMPGRHGAEKRHAGQKCWVFGVTEYGHIAAETADGERIGYLDWQIKLLDPLPPSSVSQAVTPASLANIALCMIKIKALEPRTFRKRLSKYSSDADAIQQAISSLFASGHINLARRSYSGGGRHKVYEYVIPGAPKEQAPVPFRTQADMTAFVARLLKDGKVRTKVVSNKLTMFTQSKAVAHSALTAMLANKAIKETRPKASNGCAYRILELVPTD